MYHSATPRGRLNVLDNIRSYTGWVFQNLLPSKTVCYFRRCNKTERRPTPGEHLLATLGNKTRARDWLKPYLVLCLLDCACWKRYGPVKFLNEGYIRFQSRACGDKITRPPRGSVVSSLLCPSRTDQSTLCLWTHAERDLQFATANSLKHLSRALETAFSTRRHSNGCI